MRGVALKHAVPHWRSSPNAAKFSEKTFLAPILGKYADERQMYEWQLSTDRAQKEAREDEEN